MKRSQKKGAGTAMWGRLLNLRRIGNPPGLSTEIEEADYQSAADCQSAPRPFFLSLLVVSMLSAGCTVGPDYKRPSVSVPASFRAPEPLPATQDASLASLKWFEIFKDDKLQELIRTALQQNYDLRDAAARVEAARAGLGITRSAQFPNFGADGEINFNRLSRDGATRLPPAILPSQNRTFGEATLGLLSFEIDIW